MKKIILIATTLIAFGTTSCVKNYTCECKLSGFTSREVSNDFNGLRKKDAEMKGKECVSENGTTTIIDGMGGEYTQTINCTWSKK